MIGLSSSSLDSYILLKDAAGFTINSKEFLVWSRNSFSFGSVRELDRLRASPRGSQLLLTDLISKKWDNDILRIDFYNDSLLILDDKALSVYSTRKETTINSIGVENLVTFSLNPSKSNICATLGSGQVDFYNLDDMTSVTVTDNVSYSIFTL